mmetsp:Transcript_29358/g.93630  ORF Transcript_29358/g.93630 Transcript_29358/m.93630 type:complete len:276 (+) Transcript_29358:781-1608(+)
MQPLVGALGLVEDARLRQGYHVCRESLVFGLRETFVREPLDMVDEVVLKPLLHLNVEALLCLREHHLDCDELVHLIKDLGEDLVARLDVFALELHPELVKDLEVFLELTLEALEAIGEVVLELRLDVRRDLCHVAVDVLEELLRECPQLIREVVLRAVVHDARPLENLPRCPYHIMVEPEGEILRRGCKVLVVIVEPVVLVRLHLEMLGEQANHVEEASYLLEGEVVQSVNRNKRQTLLYQHAFLQETELPGSLELHDVWGAGQLCLLLALLPHL